MTKRRFIEEHFPIKEVSEESSREKSINHGHISALHLWWARRPLAASRATIYAALIQSPTNDKDVESLKKEIAEISRWKNPLNPARIAVAKKRILDYNGIPPKVLDPFAGGGSIPLEALRLGCETYASDYNPVANLLTKAVTEYPFHHQNKVVRGGEETMEKQHIDFPLYSEVKKWSSWVLKEAKKDLARFFPDETEGEPVGYLWSRCIPCQNPRCGATIPLMKQFWLANTKNKKISLFPFVENKSISFKVVGDNCNEKIPSEFDPKNGTTSKGKATCLVCGNRMDPKRVKALFVQEKNTEKMNAVIVNPTGRSGKIYHIADENHNIIFAKARDTLRKKRESFKQKYGVDPIPDENLPPSGTLGFRVQLYGMNLWGDLFNDRQKLVMLTFMEKILKAAEIMDKNKSKNDTQALPYLGILFDRLVDKNATLCRWNPSGEKIQGVFGRQALPIVWDYAEVNPFTSVGWHNMEDWVLRVLEHLMSIHAEPATVKHASAVSLPFRDEFFDAVITDPPYYDNVPYSHLSDFFYVWLKRSIGNRFPDLFSTPLTPKSDEIVAYSDGPNGHQGGRMFFKTMLGRSFSEMHRVLKPDGIAVIVYAHKSTDGWEALIESLLKSGLVVTAAWPLHTEMKSRLRSRQSAALLSSIYMVCRKLNKKPVGFYRDVKRDLKKYLDTKLDQLWTEGISGADFFIASIGSAIEVYGKYDKVMDDKDKDVSVRDLLADTRIIVTNYAIDKVIHGEFADKISQMTRFYILYRWAHGDAKAPFDEALKLAQSVGMNLSQEIGSGFLQKDNEYVRVIGPNERSNQDNLEKSNDLIDILHHALRLWQSQKTDEANRFLTNKGHAHSEILRRIAQAISESLSDVKGSKEKDWIDGMFTGFVGAPQNQSKINIF